ncbi:hypothetical protein EXIGLDRAFT_736251 [Exidia glandulosa HHB12029]|uniref:Uncharacterized protein n=1 Tax=Exidia glandulosa HHB12029 TaxID=1314781 RepID=A0A165JGY0_EXIGL|nr:hypothetical protein EXIGLDRAFT_736251 [Exidia glandulosa HHB12029]
MTRPSTTQMPPLASPQPQPTFLGTPFATPRTQSPFEYPFIASPPSPTPHPYNHHNWTAPYTKSLKTVMPARPPPVPPTLLTRGWARTRCPDGGPVMVDSTRPAGLEALAREMQVQQTRRIRRENVA